MLEPRRGADAALPYSDTTHASGSSQRSLQMAGIDGHGLKGVNERTEAASGESEHADVRADVHDAHAVAWSP